MEEIKQKKSQLLQEDTISLYKTFFYNGWRPTLYWIIVAATAYLFIVYPILNILKSYFELKIDIIKLDNAEIISLVTLILGTTGLRGYEKFKHKELENRNEF